MDEDLLGTGLQRPRRKLVLEIEEPQPSGQNVPVPECFTHRRTDLDTEVLMQLPDTVNEPESSLASDLACMNLWTLFKFNTYIIFFKTHPQLYILFYTSKQFILVAVVMEMIKDQSDRATAGWTGFMGTPTTKETAQKAVDLIPKKWFYKEVILYLSLHPSLTPLKHIT